ncbi:MAG TPA: hypothetical protein VI357_04000 [Mycobacteriales bacterium]
MTTPQPPSDGDSTSDDLRRHAEPAVEGSDQTDADRQDQPREHSEDPAEG